MYEKLTLDNGVRIVMEHVPQVRSVSLGIWVGMGSRFERAAENGASHFIEHMVFKGTGKRSAAMLAEEMDSVGGQVNAFTTKECTCFYGRVLDSHLPILTDVLCDMFFDSLFREEDVSNERGVILEEIGMYRDTPEDLVTERLFSAVFRSSPLARPILGTPATLKNMTGAFLKDYMRSTYSPAETVVSIAGSFTQADIDELVSRFSVMAPTQPLKRRSASYKPDITVKKKAIEQNHLCFGYPGPSAVSGDRHAFQLLSSILGGGMSSRLFQSLREEKGLCYSVYSFGQPHNDTGMFGIYTALGQDAEEKAIACILDEVSRFTDGGVTQQELDRAREQTRANLLMGLESTGARMNRLGRNELLLGYVPPLDDLIKELDAVTCDDILTLSRKYLRHEDISFSAVGRTSAKERYEELLKR